MTNTDIFTRVTSNLLQMALYKIMATNHYRELWNNAGCGLGIYKGTKIEISRHSSWIPTG